MHRKRDCVAFIGGRGVGSNILMDPCSSNIWRGIRTPAALTPMHCVAVQLIQSSVFRCPHQSAQHASVTPAFCFHSYIIIGPVFPPSSDDLLHRPKPAIHHRFTRVIVTETVATAVAATAALISCRTAARWITAIMNNYHICDSSLVIGSYV